MTRTYQHALTKGARIENYEIIEVLGQGSFGITYRALDTELQTDVAIKEYFPVEIATRNQEDSSVMPHDSAAEDYEFGLERFLEEARTLARFKEPNIVRVLRFFRANGTGYIVMDYEQGETFAAYLKRHPHPDEAQLRAIFIPILDGLRAIHAQDYLHRDIKPANIYLRREGAPMLIDFGASRQALGEHSRSMTGIITPGYAPFEQYSTRSKHQPCSDIYALGATLYKAVTGTAPPEAPERIDALHNHGADPMLPAAEVAAGRYSETFLRTIDWMLAPVARDRPQSVQQVLDCLLGQREPVDADAPTRVMNPASGEKPSEAGKQPHDGPPPMTAPARRSRKRLWLVVMLVLLLASGAGAWLWLIPGYGALSIASEPEGGEWLLDGVVKGKTPGRLERVKAGKHLIVVRKPGYHSWQRIVTVERGRLLPVKATLRQITYRLTIERQPRYAFVKFLDKPYRYKPGMNLPAGRYRIRVSFPGYEPVERVIKLDRDTAFEVKLARKRYAVKVIVHPHNARISFADGKPFVQGMKLKRGQYRLHVSAPGYKSRTVSVLVSRSPRTVHVRLTKLAPAKPRYTAAQLYRMGSAAYLNKKYDQALKWLIQAAKMGHGDAHAVLGYMALQGRGTRRNPALAMRLLRKGVSLGSGWSAYVIGLMYENGKGVKKDLLRALSWYREAAGRSYAGAYNKIGWFYQNGIAVPRNYRAAARWYRKGANAGQAASMNNLGYLYFTGKGVAKSYASAKYWFEKAARNGSMIAMDWMGDLYRYGYGVARNRSMAIYWYRKAARKGLAAAKRKLRAMGVAY